MGFLTKYGTPWGAIPMTAGRIFFVAPAASYTVDGRAYSASDDNDGLSPERALVTIARAWALVTADVGDTILLLPGTHTVATASVAANVAGVSMIGLPYDPAAGSAMLSPPVTVTTSVTADEIMNLTAARIEIANIIIQPITAASGIDLTTAASQCWIHDCRIDMSTPAVSVATYGISVLGNAQFSKFENIFVDCDGAQGAALAMHLLTDSVVRNWDVMLSAGTWVSAIMCEIGVARLLIDRCRFLVGGTAALTAAIDGTRASIARGIWITGCYFDDLCTVPVDNFGANEAQLTANFKGYSVPLAYFDQNLISAIT